jgi:MFS family permease
VTSALERPPEPRPAPGPRTALHVLRQRSFAPYFAGNALSASGTWFQNLAAALLVYRLTHSPFLLGVLNFAQFIPVLLLAPWAGSAADRYDRRRLLLVSQSTAAVLSATLGILALAGAATVEVVSSSRSASASSARSRRPRSRRSSRRSSRRTTCSPRSPSTR